MMHSPTHRTSARPAKSTFALLVGVDRYDAIAGANLAGSRMDVVLLAWYCIDVLGVPRENIVALVSPMPAADELRLYGSMHTLSKLDPGSLGEATAESVRAQLDRLLARAKGEGDAALFAFSGHGSFVAEKGPVLCLADTAQDLSKGVLSLRELGQMVRERRARSKLVAVLDCCHVIGPSDPDLQVTALPSSGRPADVAGAAADFDVSDRVLLAAKPGKLAYQMRLGMHIHGALTFALVTAADRWRVSGGMSRGSYRSVMKRAKGMLAALDVPQKPTALLQDISNEPFLAVKPGPTTARPDMRGRAVQVVPNFYTLRLGSTGTILAQVVAIQDVDFYVKTMVGENQQTVCLQQHDQECWYVNKAAVASISSATKIYIGSESLPNGNSQSNPLELDPTVVGDSQGQPLFTAQETVTWSTSPTTYPSGTSYYFSGTPMTPAGDTAWLQLDVVTSDTSSDERFKLESVQWYSSEEPDDDKTNFNPTSADPWAATSTPPPVGTYAATSR